MCDKCIWHMCQRDSLFQRDIVANIPEKYFVVFFISNGVLIIRLNQWRQQRFLVRGHIK